MVTRRSTPGIWHRVVPPMGRWRSLTGRLRRAGTLSAFVFVSLFGEVTSGGPSPHGLAACQSAPRPATTAPTAPRHYTYRVVRSFPHDPNAFTQGLAIENGRLYESTGLHGRSSVRIVELETGRVLKQRDLADEHFGEGLASVGRQLYQLTWLSQKGFVYDAETLDLLREFPIQGEGWGLAYDGTNLILSDGSPVLRLLDPQTLAVRRRLEVRLNGAPVHNLNELEFIRGEIWANVWQSDSIVTIDPATGRVTGVIDLTGLFPEGPRQNTDAVLNGIAYDRSANRIFVTGKLWPRLFEIQPLPR